MPTLTTSVLETVRLRWSREQPRVGVCMNLLASDSHQDVLMDKKLRSNPSNAGTIARATDFSALWQRRRICRKRQQMRERWMQPRVSKLRILPYTPQMTTHSQLRVTTHFTSDKRRHMRVCADLPPASSLRIIFSGLPKRPQRDSRCDTPTRRYAPCRLSPDQHPKNTDSESPRRPNRLPSSRREHTTL